MFRKIPKAEKLEDVVKEDHELCAFNHIISWRNRPNFMAFLYEMFLNGIMGGYSTETLMNETKRAAVHKKYWFAFGTVHEREHLREVIKSINSDDHKRAISSFYMNVWGDPDMWRILPVSKRDEIRLKLWEAMSPFLTDARKAKEVEFLHTLEQSLEKFKNL